MRLLLTLSMIAVSCFAQTRVGLRTQGKDIDFATATSTRPVKTGIAPPVTCQVGELFYKSDAPAGANIYGCTAPDTWTAMSVAGCDANLINEADGTVKIAYSGGQCSLSIASGLVFNTGSNVLSLGSLGYETIDMDNDPAGTATNSLVVLSAGRARTAAGSAASGVIGVCVANCGSIGTATVATRGAVPCDFDGARTTDHYVIPSSMAGKCHDGGATRPTSGQILGFVGDSSGSASTGLVRWLPDVTAGAGTVMVQHSGSDVAAEPALNLLPGPGVALSVVDVPGSAVNVTPSLDTAFTNTLYPQLAAANTFTAGAKQTVQQSGTTAGLRLVPGSGDPSTLAAGDCWMDPSAQLKCYDGATVRTYVTADGTQTLTNKTITAPTIADFVNATHNHSSAAAGGTLSESALTSAVSVAKGGTGITSGVSGGVPFFAASATIASSGTLTANQPVIGGGAGSAPTVGTRSGNTTTFATTSGPLTTGNCLQIDANGNLADSGSSCGGGGGGGASPALDNLANVNINLSLLPQNGVDLGSGAKPFRNLYLFGSGTYGANYFHLTGTPTAPRTITFPNVSGTVVTSGDTASVTNAMLAGGIDNAKLLNSSVTLTPGTGITVSGGALSLGGTATITADTSVVQSVAADQLGTDRLIIDATNTNSYTGCPTPPMGYLTGLAGPLVLQLTYANTGAATLNLCALGMKSILRQGGGALSPGDLHVGNNLVTWNATLSSGVGAYEVMSPLASSSSITGGTCLNQAATAISAAGVPTCTTLTSAYVNSSIAQTGGDINTSHQVTATHLASPLPKAQGGTGADMSSVTFPSSGAVAITVASGSAALNTNVITSANCDTTTVTATGVATTDVITFTPNADITAVTGYVPLTAGSLAIIPYPTTNNVNFKVCNPTANPVTPGSVTLNWRVVR